MNVQTLKDQRQLRKIASNIPYAMQRKKRKPNPRRKNSNARNKLRQRVKMMGLPCAICGRAIDYSLPAGNEGAFELDEIVPVSKGGNPLDFNNVQPTHRRCNRLKSNKEYKVSKSDKKTDIGQIKRSRDWLEE